MVPTSWRVREGGGAMALMPRCYTAANALVRLVGRLPVGMGVLSDTAALGDRGMSRRQPPNLILEPLKFYNTLRTRTEQKTVGAFSFMFKVQNSPDRR